MYAALCGAVIFHLAVVMHSAQNVVTCVFVKLERKDLLDISHEI